MKVQKSFCYHNHTPSTIWSPFPPPSTSKPQAPEGRARLEEGSQAAALLSFPLCIEELSWRMRSEEPKRQSHIPLLAPSSNNLIAPTGPDMPLQAAAALNPQPSQAIGGCFSLLKVLVIAMESSGGRQGQAAVLWWGRHGRPPC